MKERDKTMLQNEDIKIVHTLAHNYMTELNKVKLMNSLDFKVTIYDKLKFMRANTKLKYIHFSDEELIKLLKNKTISRKKLREYQDFNTLYHTVIRVSEATVSKIVRYYEAEISVTNELLDKLFHNINNIKQLERVYYKIDFILYNLIEILEKRSDIVTTAEIDYETVSHLTTIEKTKILADKFNLS